MTDSGDQAKTRPKCSTSFAKSLYPNTAKDEVEALNDANDFARKNATQEMCQRCLGAYGLMCPLPGPQHQDQDIIPDLTPGIISEFKEHSPADIIVWIDRILRGRSIRHMPGGSQRPDIMRTVLSNFGFPQDGPTVSDETIKRVLPEIRDPIEPDILIALTEDQDRGVDPKVLRDIGYDTP